MDAIWIALAGMVFLIFNFRVRLQRYVRFEEARLRVVVGAVSVVILATFTALTRDLVLAALTAWMVALTGWQIRRSRK